MPDSIYSAVRSNFWRAAKASIPAWLANGCMPLSKLLKNTHAIDFGRKYKDKRILGDHKTWEGLAIGYSSSVVGGFAIDRIMDYGALLFDYILPPTNSIYILIAPLTVQFMDMVESRWKRSRNVPEGELRTIKEKVVDHLSWMTIYPGLYCLMHNISSPLDIMLVYGISIFGGGMFHYITNMVAVKTKWGRYVTRQR